jgi:hypothetical protein
VPTPEGADDLLCCFVHYLFNDRDLRPSTIKHYLSAVLHYWRLVRFVPSASRLYASLLAHYRSVNVKPGLFRRPFESAWLPLVLELYDDPVVPLAIALGFVFFLRVSEYAWTSEHGARLLARDLFVWEDVVNLEISVSKTDLVRRGSRHQRNATGGPCCPVRLLRAYREAHPGLAPSGPALVWRDGRPLTDHHVNAIVKAVVARAGADPAAYSSHSLRSGGVTAAHAGGAPIPVLIREGRWSSVRGLMLYLRMRPDAARGLTALMLGPAVPEPEAVE